MKVLPHDLSLPYTISMRNGQLFILITCFTAKEGFLIYWSNSFC